MFLKIIRIFKLFYYAIFVSVILKLLFLKFYLKLIF
ncbi:membrane protein [Helicobacter pylori]|nr:membrane protein [Helicobacter pylori]